MFWKNALHYTPNILASLVMFETIFRFVFWTSEKYNARFRSLSRKRQLDWSIRITAICCYFILIPCGLVILNDPVHIADKLLGSTEFANRLFAFTAGYFLWDVTICSRYYALFGVIISFHAWMGFLLAMGLLQPLFQYYGGWFLMFEISTILAHVHWFCDKYENHGWFQLINGLAFIVIFGVVRVYLGSIQLYILFSTGWQQIDRLPFGWYVFFLTASVLLQLLNYYWFYAALRALYRRIYPSDEEQEGAQEDLVEAENNFFNSLYQRVQFITARLRAPFTSTQETQPLLGDRNQ